MACEDARDNQQNNGKKRRKGILYEWGFMLFWIGFFLLYILVRAPWNSHWYTTKNTGDSSNDIIAGNDIYAGMEGVKCSQYTRYFYDSQNQLVRALIYRHPQARPDDWHEYREIIWEYDSDGRLVYQEARYVAGEEKPVSYWTEYSYTEQGYTETEYHSSQKRPIREFTYDTEGKLVASFYDDSNSYYTFTYDALGRRTGTALERHYLQIVGDGETQKTVLEGITQTVEWDGERYTRVEGAYSIDGTLLDLWIGSSDDDWQVTQEVWCDGKDVPEKAEDIAPLCRLEYWADYRDGLLVEELSRERNGIYQVYDYNEDGNRTLALAVYLASGYTYMERYVYDEQGRLEEEYIYYDLQVQSWEQQLCDESVISIQRNDEMNDLVSISRTAEDGELLNFFVFDGDGELDVQYTPTVTWLQEPYVTGMSASGLTELSWKQTILELAEERKEDPTELVGGWASIQGLDDISENLYDDSGNEQVAENLGDLGEIWEPEEYGGFWYTVQPGDSLWNIAERHLGSGTEFVRIYEGNRDVVGEYPGRILPGMRLYIPESSRKLTDEQKMEYLSAYREIIEQLEAENPGKRVYNLIYLDEDAVPELVADVRGYYVSVYTYDAGQAFLVMDDWGYGAFGIAGYEYIPRQNIIFCCDVDGAGLVLNFFYGRINEIHEYEDFRFVWCETGDYESDEWCYYNEYTEINEEEFDSLLIDGEFTYIEGIYPGREMLEGIRQEIERLEGR